MRIADVLDLNKYLGCQTTGAKSGLELHGLSNSSLEVEESSGVTVEQLLMRMLRPTRISRAHETCQISLSDDMFSSDSKDEEYDADGQAYAEGVNPHAEVEETAAVSCRRALMWMSQPLPLSSNVPRWSRNGSRCILEVQDIVWYH